MADVKYTPPNAAEWLRLATNPFIRRALMAEGRVALNFAHMLSYAHVVTGEYERSFQLVESTLFINGHPRAAVRLENTSPHAAALEWGNTGNRHGPDAHSDPALIFTRTLRYLGAERV